MSKQTDGANQDQALSYSDRMPTSAPFRLGFALHRNQRPCPSALNGARAVILYGTVAVGLRYADPIYRAIARSVFVVCPLLRTRSVFVVGPLLRPCSRFLRWGPIQWADGDEVAGADGRLLINFCFNFFSSLESNQRVNHSMSRNGTINTPAVHHRGSGYPEKCKAK